MPRMRSKSPRILRQDDPLRALHDALASLDTRLAGQRPSTARLHEPAASSSSAPTMRSIQHQIVALKNAFGVLSDVVTNELVSLEDERERMKRKSERLQDEVEGLRRELESVRRTSNANAQQAAQSIEDLEASVARLQLASQRVRVQDETIAALEARLKALESGQADALRTAGDAQRMARAAAERVEAGRGDAERSVVETRALAASVRALEEAQGAAKVQVAVALAEHRSDLLKVSRNLQHVSEVFAIRLGVPPSSLGIA
eukprot:tig00021312_g20076.t1